MRMAKSRGRPAGFKMTDEHRAKIANSQVLKGLIEFAEGKKTSEEYPPHRVTAALGLLKKVMPDMTHTELSGDQENPVAVTQISLVAVQPDD